MASTKGYNIEIAFSILIIFTSIVDCQAAPEATISNVSVLESATGSNSSNQDTNDPETSISGSGLISASEFVDFTESPTLLFDGTSNQDNDTESSTESSRLPAAATTTSSKESSKTSEIIEATTTISSATNEDEDSETSEPETKEAFEPPRNVSQYMDYIETLFHDLRHQISDLFEPHLPQLIRSSQMVQLSSSCSYDMLRMALALRQFEPWALKMIDSSGKVPEGIFEGSFTALGSYDECLNTVFGQQEKLDEENANHNQSRTQGQYCLVNVSPYLPPKPPADRVERMFQEEANRRNYTKDNQFSRLSPMFYYMKFRIGICIPSTCTESDMDSLSEALSSSLRLNITIPNCRIRKYQPITNHQLVGGLVFASIVVIVFGATLMDYSGRKFDRQKRNVVMSLAQFDDTMKVNRHHQGDLDDKEVTKVNYLASGSQGRFLGRLSKDWSWLSFSLFTNYRLHFSALSRQTNKLKACQEQLVGPSNNNNAQIIRCLNGIRVISLCWVIVANSYITLDPRATKRLTKTREAPKDFLFQMVAQASLAIETFFFLSGVLMSLSFARKLQPEVDLEVTVSSSQTKCSIAGDEKRDQSQQRRLVRLRWVQFYVHRYVRMTPATMLVIAFAMYAYGYGDGPLWFEATYKSHQSCSQNWWRHLLHVANFIDTRQMCFIHYWYIAADMQLFLFAPLLMFLIYRYRRIGYALVTLIGAASMGSIFYTTYMRNLPPTLLFYNSDPESRREFGNTIMTKPLTHALPYLVGMLVGKWLTTSSPIKTTTSQSSKQQLNSQLSINHHHQQGGDGRSLTTLFGVIATCVALAEVFLPYKWNNSHLPTRLLAALYAAFFRFAWSLVLAYVIVSCRHRRTRRCIVPASRSSVNDQTVAMSKLTPTNPIKQPCASCQSLDHATIVGSPLAATSAAAATGKYDENIIMTSTTLGITSKSMIMATENDEHWCLCGSGGNLVNRLLSLDVFTFLSKLSFVAYLIHLPLMSVFIAQTRGLFAFSHTLVIHLALSYLVMTFLLSFLLVHLIELPFLTFERYLFERLFYHPNEQYPSAKIIGTPTHSDTNATVSGDYMIEQSKSPMGQSGSGYTINSSNGIMLSVSERL